MSAAEIVEQFRSLPLEEQREVFVQRRDEFEDELTPEQIAVLEERAERLRRNPERGIPWEQVRAEMMALAHFGGPSKLAI
jgi:hypothetical protein